jgi:rhamnose transport system permease protein
VTTALLRSRQLPLAAVTLLLLGAIAAVTPSFVAPGNLADMLDDTAILIMLALAQMIVLVPRGIDLSIASNLALCGMIVALVDAAHPEVGVPLLILLGILSGIVLGAINGLLVWQLEIPPIVTTLGTLAVYRGLVFLLSGGAWVNPHQMSAAFLTFPRTLLLNVTVLSWIAVAMVAAAALLLRYTRLGRAFYAAGCNPTAAIYAGIDPARTQFLGYTICGAVAGLCGYLWVARYSVAYVDIAKGFELNVIAACLIGGVSIAGGTGTVAGVVLGALFLGLIKNALPVMHISPFWQLGISGAVIVVAVLINLRSERGSRRLILKNSEAGR